MQVLARVMIHPLLAVEGHEDHPKRVERRDVDAGRDTELRVPGTRGMRQAHGVDQRVLRKES